MVLTMLGRHKYITVELLESENNSVDVEIITEKLKRFQSQGTDIIPSELILAGSKALH